MKNIPQQKRILGLAILTLGLTACAGMGDMKQPAVPMLPESVSVPAGEKLAWWTIGTGELTYECRPKKDMAGQFEWVFVGPVATLADRDGKTVGKYYAGPTWAANDGSKVSGKQLAVAPAGAANIPMQLVKADPAMGMGAMQGVTYIQRINTVGGVAPTAVCGMTNTGAKMQVKYQADYLFYKKA